MDFLKVSSVITRTAVILVFWFVFLFSLLMEEELTLLLILFDGVKALFVSGVAWIVLGVLMDTLVKSIVHSAKHKDADRFDGGISYHFIKPSEEEEAWQKNNGEEIEENDAEKPKK
jgi:hypothetical protein